MFWILNILIALDQLINAILYGYADETLSSRAWRWYIGGVRTFPKIIIDSLFFWENNHCRNAYESERLERHLPPEFRKI